MWADRGKKFMAGDDWRDSRKKEKKRGERLVKKGKKDSKRKRKNECK